MFVKLKKRQLPEYYKRKIYEHIRGIITLSDKQIQECIKGKNK